MLVSPTRWPHKLSNTNHRYKWGNGAFYVGSFVNNKMHGKGEYTDASGKAWKGHFYNGVGPGLTLEYQ